MQGFNNSKLNPWLKASKFTNDLGQEILVVNGVQIAVVNNPYWADVINWFENGRLVVGTKNNPCHVAKWQAWNVSL